MSRTEWHPDHSEVRLIHSASSLDTLQACARKYQLKYVLGWRSRVKSQYADAAKFGHLIHAAMNEFDVCRLEGAEHDESLLSALRVAIEMCEVEEMHYSCMTCEEPLNEPEKNKFLGFPDVCPKCRIPLNAQWDLEDANAKLEDVNVKVEEKISWWLPEENNYKLHQVVRTVVWGADTMEKGNIKPVEAMNADPEAEGEEFLVEFPRSYNGESYWLRGYFDGVAEIPPYPSRYVRERKTTTKTISGAGYRSRFAPNTQIELYSWAAPIWAKIKGFEGDFVGVLLDAFQAAVGFTRTARFTLNPSDDVKGEFVQDMDHYLSLAEMFAVVGYWPKNRSSCFLCQFKKVCSAPKSARPGLLAKEFEQNAERS